MILPIWGVSKGEGGRPRDSLARKLRAATIARLYIDRGGGPESAVLLAGSPRSGTSWLAELINFRKDYRYIFEPFHPNHSSLARNFVPRQYIRATDRDPKFLAPAEAILSGRLRGLWTDKYNEARLPRVRLIKEVRANLLLGWLKACFPSLRVVLLMRHPCATVLSQVRVGWDWHVEPWRFLNQEDLMTDHLDDFASVLESAKDPIQAHAVAWCVDQYVPLRQLGPADIHIVHYEHLCTAPAAEVRRVCDFLRLPYDERVGDSAGRPSPLADAQSAVVSHGDLVRAWQTRLSPEHYKSILDAVGEFGLDRLYGSDPFPRSVEGRG